jgi:glutaredoxin
MNAVEAKASAGAGFKIFSGVLTSKAMLIIVLIFGIIIFTMLMVFTARFFLTGKTVFHDGAPDVKTVEMFEGAGVSVDYYTLNGCPHCTAFNPEWAKFEVEAKKKGIQTAKYEAREHRDKIAEAGVDGFPTIMITKHGKRYVYEGPRKADALLAESLKA